MLREATIHSDDRLRTERLDLRVIVTKLLQYLNSY